MILQKTTKPYYQHKEHSLSADGQQPRCVEFRNTFIPVHFASDNTPHMIYLNRASIVDASGIPRPLYASPEFLLIDNTELRNLLLRIGEPQDGY